MEDALETLVLLLAMWWVWSFTAWLTDLVDPQRPAVQLVVTAAMLGSLVMAVAAPEAFGEQGLIFAGAYVAIHLGRGLFLILGLRGHEAQRLAMRVLFWFGVSAVPWIAGALVQGTTRGALWTLAVAVDYIAFARGFPTPGLGRAPAAEWAVVAEHLAERYRQFFIIALGVLTAVDPSIGHASGTRAGLTGAL